MFATEKALEVEHSEFSRETLAKEKEKGPPNRNPKTSFFFKHGLCAALIHILSKIPDSSEAKRLQGGVLGGGAP